MRLFLLLGFFGSLLTPFSPRVWAQGIPNPSPGALYADSTVPRIDLWIPIDSLNALFDHPQSDHEYRVVFSFWGNGLRDTVTDVGFRLKGNTSRSSAKKSFKISFNTFSAGRRWQSVKDINLHGEHNDPSISRARVGWNLARQLGLAACRVNHVQLYINGQYFGVYANVEHINDDYVQQRFGSDDGNLYKCLYPAPLLYLSDNPNAYKYVAQGRRAYELKTNELADDYSDLSTLIKVLNQTPSAQLICALDTLLDLNEFLLTLALEVNLGHWDDYAINKNNYYLYKSPVDQRFHFLLYDIDNTLGIDWFGIDWATRPLYMWSTSNHPLYSRLMAHPEIKARFSTYVAMVSSQMNSTAFRLQVLGYRDQLYPYIGNDLYRTYDYGFTSNDFVQSFTSAYGSHVTYGLLPFISQRVASTASQLLTPSAHPLLHSPTLLGQQRRLSFSAEMCVLDTDSVTKVGLRIAAGATVDTVWLTPTEKTNQYAASFLWPLEGSSCSYQFFAQDLAGHVSRWPCAPKSYPFVESSSIYLNELSASHASGDWIELFNPTPDSVFLGDYYLSNKATFSEARLLPAVTLAPGSFYLLWASGDSVLDASHLPFVLAREGETLSLWKAGGTLMDQVTYPSLEEGQWYARIVDGYGAWALFRRSTRGHSNRGRYDVDIQPVVSPNPHGTILSIHNPLPFPLEASVFSADGQCLGSYRLQPQSKTSWVDVHPPGVRHWVFYTLDGMPWGNEWILKGLEN